jgi:hypothetical protein
MGAVCAEWVLDVCSLIETLAEMLRCSPRSVAYGRSGPRPNSPGAPTDLHRPVDLGLATTGNHFDLNRVTAGTKRSSLAASAANRDTRCSLGLRSYGCKADRSKVSLGNAMDPKHFLKVFGGRVPDWTHREAV